MSNHRLATAAAAALIAVSLATVASAGTNATSAPSGVPAGDGAPLLAAAAPYALDHVRAHAETFQASADDLGDLEVTDTVPVGTHGATVVYVRQRVGGIPIRNAISSVVVQPDGSVPEVASRIVGGVDERIVGSTTPTLRPVGAATAALDAIDLSATEAVTVVERPTGTERSTVLSDGGVAADEIPASLVYQLLDDGSLRLAWDVEVDVAGESNVWQVRIDAATGEELDRNNLVVHEAAVSSPAGTPAASGRPASAPAAPVESVLDKSQPLVADSSSYSVIAPPAEAPTFTSPAGTRATVNQPADRAASPFGWHDTNAVAGAESFLTTGNNVSAYTDTNNDDLVDVGSQPNGGAGLDFTPALDLAQDPSTYRAAAVTNMFFWNNHIHDVLWHYGFDEASGNFQVNNYGNGGRGNDAVRAEAQDGGATNNANFDTPPDGQSPRMQMYVFDLTSPFRDAALDNGVVAHEYGHGVSNRLTAGPSNVTCLNNDEQPGEGWSDFYGYMLTMDPSDGAGMALTGSSRTERGIGTYVLGQGVGGIGIRAAKYSTSMTTDPRTYTTIASNSTAIPHGVGSVFAAMLWEMTAGLVDEYGYDPNVSTGDGGNNIALRLVTDGLKLQPCSPGFVDARDAILLADRLEYDGANQCVIWKAFAKRGLGTGAQQGSPFDRADGTASFTVPTWCEGIAVSAEFTAASTPSIGTATLRVHATNVSGASASNVKVAATIPPRTTVRAGSGRCVGGGATVSVSGGSVRFALGTLAAGVTRTCTVGLSVWSDDWSTVTFSDDFESGLGKWTMPVAVGTDAWTTSTGRRVSGTRSAFAIDDPAAVDSGLSADFSLRTKSAITVGASTELSFSHWFRTEPGYDGGMVEISTDGGTTWSDVGAGRLGVQRYNGALGDFCPTSGTAGRPAFTWDNGGFARTTVDLSGYAGKTVRIRFRMVTDCGNEPGSWFVQEGWYVDDVRVTDAVRLTTQVTATATGLTGGLARARTDLVAPRCNGKVVTVEMDEGDRPTNGNDVIIGTRGNDVIDAKGGNDTVCAGPGNDTVSGGSGKDSLDGGDGRDGLTGGPGSDRCVGGTGKDTAASCETTRQVP